MFSSCSWASSRDRCLMAPPWRKHNSNHRLPLRLNQPPALPEPQHLAIWLQWRCNNVDWTAKQRRKVKEQPLELHRAALEEDKNSKFSKPNECFFVFSFVAFFNLCLVCWKVGRYLLNVGFFSMPEGWHQTQKWEKDCKECAGLRMQWDACRVSSRRFLWRRVP